MELPVTVSFEEDLPSLQDRDFLERVRILDIDGTYLVSIFHIQKESGKLLKNIEVAFDALYEAEEFLYDELQIDFPSIDPEKKECYDECNYSSFNHEFFDPNRS